MAKLRSGILGNIRGKVAGVVGGQFKDVNYIREYVKPANPNTTAQQTQRGKMADVVAFAKTLVGPIFNEYTDKFQKSMSGFNFFIKQSISEFDGSPDYSLIKLSEGKLSPVSNLACSYMSGSGALAISWDQNLGNNGSVDDELFWAVYNETTGIWYFADAVKQRDDDTDQQVIDSGLTATDMHIWALCAARNASDQLLMVSDTDYAAVTAL